MDCTEERLKENKIHGMKLQKLVTIDEFYIFLLLRCSYVMI